MTDDCILLYRQGFNSMDNTHILTLLSKHWHTVYKESFRNDIDRCVIIKLLKCDSFESFVKPSAAGQASSPPGTANSVISVVVVGSGWVVLLVLDAWGVIIQPSVSWVTTVVRCFWSVLVLVIVLAVATKALDSFFLGDAIRTGSFSSPFVANYSGGGNSIAFVVVRICVPLSFEKVTP